MSLLKKRHKMTLYDLALFLAFYFIGLLVLIILYGLVDMIDRKQRLEHQRKVSEEQMLINIKFYKLCTIFLTFLIFTPSPE